MLLTRLNEVDDEEDEKLNDTLSKVSPKAEFYRRLGEAVMRPAKEAVELEWKSAECMLSTSVKGSEIFLSGSYEKEALSLFGMLAKRMERHTVEFSGQIRGQTIIGDVSRYVDGKTRSTLADLGSSKSTFLMYFDRSGTELHVLENPQSVAPKIYVLTAIGLTP